MKNKIEKEVLKEMGFEKVSILDLITGHHKDILKTIKLTQQKTAQSIFKKLGYNPFCKRCQYNQELKKKHGVK